MIDGNLLGRGLIPRLYWPLCVLAFAAMVMGVMGVMGIIVGEYTTRGGTQSA